MCYCANIVHNLNDSHMKYLALASLVILISIIPGFSQEFTVRIDSIRSSHSFGDKGISTFQYDQSNQLIGEEISTDFRHQKKSYTYDQKGKLRTETFWNYDFNAQKYTSKNVRFYTYQDDKILSFINQKTDLQENFIAFLDSVHFSYFTDSTISRTYAWNNSAGNWSLMPNEKMISFDDENNITYTFSENDTISINYFAFIGDSLRINKFCTKKASVWRTEYLWTSKWNESGHLIFLEQKSLQNPNNIDDTLVLNLIQTRSYFEDSMQEKIISYYNGSGSVTQRTYYFNNQKLQKFVEFEPFKSGFEFIYDDLGNLKYAIHLDTELKPDYSRIDSVLINESFELNQCNFPPYAVSITQEFIQYPIYIHESGLKAAFNNLPIFFNAWPNESLDFYYTPLSTSSKDQSFRDRAYFFPNPTFGNINFVDPKNSNDQMFRWMIFDSSGKLMVSKFSNQQIDIDALPVGIYYIQVISNNKLLYTDKIIKQ